MADRHSLLIRATGVDIEASALTEFDAATVKPCLIALSANDIGNDPAFTFSEAATGGVAETTDGLLVEFPDNLIRWAKVKSAVIGGPGIGAGEEGVDFISVGVAVNGNVVAVGEAFDAADEGALTMDSIIPLEDGDVVNVVLVSTSTKNEEFDFTADAVEASIRIE